MLSANPLSSKSMLIAAAFAMLTSPPMHAQEGPSININYVRFTGVPDDWSHHRVVFSDPGTENDAIRKGKHEQWLKTVNDPRYVLHQLKHDGTVRGPAANDVAYWRALRAEDAADRAAHGEGHGRWEKDKHKKKGPGGPEIKGDWSMSMGAGAKVGAGQYPAKFSFITTSANCASDTPPDFVVYNTGLAGTGGAAGNAGAAGQASIIAFDNLYSGCTTGLMPSVYWSYNTGGTVNTSVVISSDGTQIAFVQSPTTGSAGLVVLKWQAGEGVSAGNPNSAGVPSIPAQQTTVGSTYATCRAGATSCQLTLAFSGTGTHADTRSSPFYDYVNDVLYVGDNLGVLHKFTGVFSGAPAEVVIGWPVTIVAGAILTSPVLDSNSVPNNVLVGTGGGNGALHRVSVDGGTVTHSGALSGSSGTGVIDAPMLDTSAQRVYAFAAQDNSGNCNNGGGQVCRAGVYALPTNFASGTTGTKQLVGGANFSPNGGTAVGTTMYDGTFDNIYFTSADFSNPSGNLYVCGFATGSSIPALWQIPITNNAMGTPIAGPALSTSGSSICSPVSEFFNSPTDYIFTSVTAGNVTGAPIGCPSTPAGCVMSFDVTSAAGFSPTKTAIARAAETGGTSGVIIDNSVSSPTGTSQVYFTPLLNQTCIGNTQAGAGLGGCATQASQAGLN